MRVRAFRSYNFSRRTDLNFPSIFSEVAPYLFLQDMRDFSFFSELSARPRMTIYMRCVRTNCGDKEWTTQRQPTP